MPTCVNCGLSSDTEFRFCPQCGMQSLALHGGPAGLVGQTLCDKYRIVEALGEGSMGTVYLAEHVSLKKKIAIKLLHKELEVSDETLKRFQREGIAASQVDHPNAIQIFDFDRAADGSFFLAMEFVKGESLKSWLAARGPFEAEAAIGLLRQLLGTLAQAHAHGIVHRDLKPENLMIASSTTGNLSLKVLDFGLSKLVDRPLDASLRTQAGRLMGTPLYMAPEQWRGEEVDHRADLYAAALIFYEMLTGCQPFKGSDLSETMIRSTTAPPPPLLDANPGIRVPAGLDDFLRTALAKQRTERFQSARDMIDALEGKPFGGPARPVRRRRPERRGWPRLRSASPRPIPAKAIAVAGAGLVALLAAGYLMSGGSGARGAQRAPLVRTKDAASRTADERAYLALLDAARAHLRERDAAAASGLADAALRMACCDAEGFLVRAAAHRHAGDDDAALADLREALVLHQSYGAADAAIGWIHFDGGAVDRARERFAAAVAADGACAEGWAGLAAVASARGEPAAAASMLARTEAILAPVLRLRAPICDEHALPRAGVDRTAVIDALERALARGAGEAGRIEALLGGLLLQEQQWQAAGEHLARAVAIDGSRADALVDLGIARFWLGDHPGAAARFEQALERAPGDAFAHYSLGVLYKDHLQQPAKALRHLREHRRLGGTGAHVDEWIQALER